MKVLSVVYWSMASPWTGYSKRARCAWTWRGGPSRAGISTSCYRQLSFHASYPGPAQSPHAQWLPSKSMRSVRALGAPVRGEATDQLTTERAFIRNHSVSGGLRRRGQTHRSAPTSRPRPVMGHCVRRAPVCAPSYHLLDSTKWSLPSPPESLNGYFHTSLCLCF